MSTKGKLKLALFSTCILATAAILGGCSQSPSPGSAQIKWDSHGVPHIFAADDEALFYAFGWAQMHSHANLILSLYGSARGRASEYWGEERLGADALIHALEVPETAARAYAGQNPDFKRLLDLFVKGMNDYADSHPEAVEEKNRAVLPVRPEDLFAHVLRAMELGFVGRRILFSGAMQVPMGSNAIALSPSRTANGHAMLLTNPHLPWRDAYTFYEAHLNVRQRDFYGASLIGFPVLVLAFNERLGWAHTANYVDGADLYEIEVIDEGRYLFDGQITEFEKRTQPLKVKGENGQSEDTQLTLPYAKQGPVVLRRGETAYAYRSTRGLYPLLFEQYWKMINSNTLEEFEDALRMMQVPYFNVIYADREGHIMYMWNGLLPDRSVGDADFWLKSVPGDRSQTLWADTIDFERLPRITDPPSGWVQNTNDLPWTSTLPAALDPSGFPSLIPDSEIPGLRTQQLLATLEATPLHSFESLRKIKFENRVELADRILDDLLAAIGGSPHGGADRELLDRCRKVLENWDRRVDAESRGAVLFRAWLRRLGAYEFAVGFDPEKILTTPRGLKDPHKAVDKLLQSAQDVIGRYQALDVPWGDVHRLKRGEVEMPASGGPGFMGIFHSTQFSGAPDGKFYSLGGESFSSIVEFSDPVRAEVLLSYGNSSQKGSKHNGGQLELVASKTMRKALISPEDIEKELDRVESVAVGVIEPR